MGIMNGLFQKTTQPRQELVLPLTEASFLPQIVRPLKMMGEGTSQIYT